MSKEEFSTLSKKEQEVLKKAVNVLYYTDSSDYGTALYQIVKVLTGKQSVDEDDVIELYNEINEEEE